MQVPPAEVRPEAFPKQVWATLKEARRAANLNGRSLVVFVPEDGTRHSAAVGFFKSLEGMKARRDAEVWLPVPGDPEATQVMDELGLRSLPSLVWLSSSAKHAVRSRLGEASVPLVSAFEKLFEVQPISGSFLRDWIGKSQPLEPYLAFAKARKEDLGAGANEPHRSWLMGLVKGPDSRLRNWAATRLVEADAPVKAEEPRPFPLLVELLKARFEKEVRQGNRDRSESKGGYRIINDSSWASEPDPPLNDLGSSGRIHEKAPFWPVIRGFLRNDPAMKVHIPIYVLMAPELLEIDKAWILLHLERESKVSKPSDPRGAALYWIATDWLLAYGKASDWEVFRNAMTPMAWDEALVRLLNEVKRVPEYWNSEPTVQSMFCEGGSLEAFWENPDSCLAAWGVTREALVEFGMDKMKSKGTPAPPRYPEEAKQRGFSTNLRLRMVVGADGSTKWVRPEPGYALAFFAPAGIAYAIRWQFEPARVAGVARPSQFRLNMPFGLRR